MTTEKLDAEQVNVEEAAAFEDAFMAEFPGEEESEDGTDGEEEKDSNESGDDDAADEGDAKSEDADAGESEEEEEESEESSEDDDEEKVTLKKTAEEAGSGKKVKLPIVQKHPDLQDGDYLLGADGKYIVKSAALAQDIDTIMRDRVGTYLKIYKAKPAKAEAIAKIIGVQPDGTRTAGRVFADVVRALETVTPEKAKELVALHIPTLADPNREDTYVLDLPGQPKTEESENEDADAVISQDAIMSATYRVVAERGGEVSLDEVLDSPEVAKAFSSFLTDNQGNELGVYDRLSMAIAQVFPKGKPTVKKADEGDDARAASAAGSSKKGGRSSSGGGAEAAESKAFEDVLTEGM